MDKRCTAPGLRFEILRSCFKKSIIGEGDPSRSTEGPFSQSIVIYVSYLYYVIWCTCTNNIFFPIGYDTKVISKQRTRKASTTSDKFFLLVNGNPGHHIALLACICLSDISTRRHAPKRSFRTPICRLLTVSIGRLTAFTHPK